MTLLPVVLVYTGDTLRRLELSQTKIVECKGPWREVRRSYKLSQSGRCSQVVVITVDLPWPLSPREVVLDACAFDDIDVTVG